MSHLTERTEKNCLNCSATVLGRYCQHCGQENVEMKQSFWQMLKHFVYDIFHFDGKFFETLKYLIVKPGLVAKQYSEGKRESYLNPIRMYLFISAITFILLPLFSRIERTMENVHILATPSERLNEASRNYQLIKDDPNNQEALQNLTLLMDSTVFLRLKNVSDSTPGARIFKIGSKEFKAVPVKESLIFPEDTWLNKRASATMRKKFKEEGGNLNKLITSQSTILFKMLPYMLFLSLPIFAFILKALYNKNRFYFSDHSVFTLYHYISTFFVIVLLLFLNPLVKLVHLDPLTFLYIPFFALLMLYLLLELKFFYKESWTKTLLKFLMVIISSFATIALLFLVFLYIIYIN